MTLAVAGFLIRTARKWELTLESETEPAMDEILPQDTAWRMFTKVIDPETARASEKWGTAAEV